MRWVWPLALVALAGCGDPTYIALELRGLKPEAVDAGQPSNVALQFQYACGPVPTPTVSCAFVRSQDASPEPCEMTRVRLLEAHGRDCSENAFWTWAWLDVSVTPSTSGPHRLSVTFAPVASEKPNTFTGVIDVR